MTPPPPLAFPPAAADHALVERIVADERIARGLPSPDWSEWFVDVARAGIDALPDVLAPLRGVIEGLGISMDTAANVLAATIAATIAVVAVLAAVRRLRRRRADPLPADVADHAGRAVPVRDPDAWHGLVDEHLRAGRIAEALEAAWWWLAASIHRGPVDPSWTSRELLARAGRPDLREWAAALDRLTYGPRRPHADDVRGLVLGLESAV